MLSRGGGFCPGDFLNPDQADSVRVNTEVEGLHELLKKSCLSIAVREVFPKAFRPDFLEPHLELLEFFSGSDMFFTAGSGKKLFPVNRIAFISGEDSFSFADQDCFPLPEQGKLYVFIEKFLGFFLFGHFRILLY